MLDLTAMVVLHLGRVLADCAVLAALGLEEPCNNEDERGSRAPDCSLRYGVENGLTFQELSDANDGKGSNENSQKALNPKASTQELLPVRSNTRIEPRASARRLE